MHPHFSNPSIQPPHFSYHCSIHKDRNNDHPAHLRHYRIGATLPNDSPKSKRSTQGCPLLSHKRANQENTQKHQVVVVLEGACLETVKSKKVRIQANIVTCRDMFSSMRTITRVSTRNWEETRPNRVPIFATRYHLNWLTTSVCFLSSTLL